MASLALELIEDFSVLAQEGRGDTIAALVVLVALYGVREVAIGLGAKGLRAGEAVQLVSLGNSWNRRRMFVYSCRKGRIIIV